MLYILLRIIFRLSSQILYVRQFIYITACLFIFKLFWSFLNSIIIIVIAITIIIILFSNSKYYMKFSIRTVQYIFICLKCVLHVDFILYFILLQHNLELHLKNNNMVWRVLSCVFICIVCMMYLYKSDTNINNVMCVFRFTDGKIRIGQFDCHKIILKKIDSKYV